MTLLRRAPREVYRVYSEEEFFDRGEELFDRGEDELFAGGASVEPCEPVVAGAGEQRLRRLAGVAALAGAVGAVGATFALTGSRPSRGAGGHAVADTGATARRRISASAHAVALPRAGRPTSAVGRSIAAVAVGSRRPRGEHRSFGRIDGMRGRGEGVRRYGALTPRTAPGRELARNAPAVETARVTVGPVAETSQPRHAEFGFER